MFNLRCYSLDSYHRDKNSSSYHVQRDIVDCQRDFLVTLVDLYSVSSHPRIILIPSYLLQQSHDSDPRLATDVLNTHDASAYSTSVVTLGLPGFALDEAPPTPRLTTEVLHTHDSLLASAAARSSANSTSERGTAPLSTVDDYPLHSDAEESLTSSAAAKSRQRNRGQHKGLRIVGEAPAGLVPSSPLVTCRGGSWLIVKNREHHSPCHHLMSDACVGSSRKFAEKCPPMLATVSFSGLHAQP